MTTPDDTAGAVARSGAARRSLRVVLVVEQLRRSVPGGVGRYVTGLLQGLADMAEAGDRLPDVVLHASRPPPGDDPLAAFGWELTTSRLPGPALTRAWDRAMTDVPGDVDVIHALSLASPPARHAPLVVTVHDMAWRTVPETFPGRGRRWHRAAFDRARRRAVRLVVPSDPAARDVVDAGADPASIVVIPHGSDHLPAPDRTSAAALLEGLGVEGDFLLSVGTLEPRKNLARLIEAYGRARPGLPGPWPLVVVGPGGWGRSPLAGAEGHVAGVVPTGPVDDATLAGLYGRARLLAYVPLTEGFGFPPVEAMRQGVPVVASPMPSLGGAGLVVDPAQVDDIASGLVAAATDETRRAALVDGGLERTQEMTWRASARAHVALWESLA
ncbi:MAG TPA: glycosyltransferase family 1 protein [Acidimicrobiales bacterium]|nr:glycosyltransferase family 1 protein [Acidimicrobiales bacterium]